MVSTPPDPDGHLNVRATAKRLGVHENTVRNWANSGRLPAIRMPDSGFRRFREADVEQLASELTSPPTYHDLHITAYGISRTSIFNLPYGYTVTCSRVTGWQVWGKFDDGPERLIAGEYEGDDAWLVLDVAGRVIVDSRASAEVGASQ